jgi:hypothetical protein
MRCVNGHRLEGSRFGAYRMTSQYSFERFIRPKNVATGGSRELPSAMHVPMASIRLYPDHRAANRWDVPGSRLFSHVSAGPIDEAKLRGVAGYMPKRLPSRRWSAYTGTLKCRRRVRVRDGSLSMSQIQLVHQLIIPKIFDGAFSRDFAMLQ